MSKISEVKNYLVTKKNALYWAFAGATITLGTASASADASSSSKELVLSVTDIVYMVFRYVGILLLLWGIVQIVLAFQREDGDGKVKGMTMAIIAIVLITLKLTIGNLIESLI